MTASTAAKGPGTGRPMTAAAKVRDRGVRVLLVALCITLCIALCIALCIIA